MSKRMFRSKRKVKEDIDLQITAMASVFTVILVFLLKSVSTDASPIQATSEIELPELISPKGIESAFKVELTGDAILFEGQKVLSLSAFQLPEGTTDFDGTIRDLTAKIKETRERKADQSERPLVALFADKKAPQSLVEKVISSAARGGLYQVQLIVASDEK
jgi:biopolymer transport protein ExbD